MAVMGPVEELETAADLLEHLGGVAPARVRLWPAPGRAREADLRRSLARRCLCELIDGVLVEKVSDAAASAVAASLTRLLGRYRGAENVGWLAGPTAPLRLRPGLVYLPDVFLVRWGKLPRRRIPRKPIPQVVPALIVEVLSEGNTPGEVGRKRHEYRFAGIEAVWLVDPGKRTVAVHTSTGQQGTVLTEADTLDGSPVLPGLDLPVRRVFEHGPRGEGPAVSTPPR